MTNFMLDVNLLFPRIVKRDIIKVQYIGIDNLGEKKLR